MVEVTLTTREMIQGGKIRLAVVRRFLLLSPN